MECDKQQLMNMILLHHRCVPPCSEGAWCQSCMTRMMYADWLEENSREESDHARVQFIRKQIRGKDIPKRAQHRMCVDDRMYLGENLKFNYEVYLRECVKSNGGDWIEVDHRYDPESRVHTFTYEGDNSEWVEWNKECAEMVKEWGEQWTTIDQLFGLHPPNYVCTFDGVYDLSHRYQEVFDDLYGPAPLDRVYLGSTQTPVITWKYSRGFINHIELRRDDLLRHGKELFKDSPIESVVLTDQYIPPVYLNMVSVVTEFHGVRGEGLRHEEALNNAIVNWGRVEAGIVSPKSQTFPLRMIV